MDLLKQTITNVFLKQFFQNEMQRYISNMIDERYEQNRVKLTLEKEDIAKLTQIKYSDYDSEIKNNNKNCSICLEYFEDTDECRELKCNHFFHSSCVDKWLLNFSHKCPMCRDESENYKAQI